MPFLDRPGTRLFYERIDGPDDRPVLVFLHEGLGCIAMWKEFPALLCAAAGLPGLLYDRAGFGRSSPATPRTTLYLHESALEELPGVRRQALPGREHVAVGHSDGGSIALLYAASRPPGLLAVITEAAHVKVETETLRGVEAAVRAWEEGKLEGLRRHHGAKTDALFHAWSAVWRNPEFHAWNIEDALSSIECPVLALQGADDQYGTPAQVDSILARVPRARGVLLEHCGHAPHHEQPGRTLELMRDFVREVAND